MSIKKKSIPNLQETILAIKKETDLFIQEQTEKDIPIPLVIGAMQSCINDYMVTVFGKEKAAEMMYSVADRMVNRIPILNIKDMLKKDKQ